APRTAGQRAGDPTLSGARARGERCSAGSGLLVGGNDVTEQSIALTIRTRREVQRVRARPAAAAQGQGPQAVDDQRLALSVVKRIDKPAIVLECVDPAVAKVADEDLAAEPPKRERGAGDAPRGVERPAAGKAAQQMAVGIKHIDKATAWPRRVVVFLSVAFRLAPEQV